jgi:hypothetical protein
LKNNLLKKTYHEIVASITMSFTISVAVRSQLSPPKGFTYIKPCVVKDTVEAPNLQLLAYATEQHIKCGNITKSGSITKSGAITKKVYQEY